MRFFTQYVLTLFVLMIILDRSQALGQSLMFPADSKQTCVEKARKNCEGARQKAADTFCITTQAADLLKTFGNRPLCDYEQSPPELLGWCYCEEPKIRISPETELRDPTGHELPQGCAAEREKAVKAGCIHELEWKALTETNGLPICDYGAFPAKFNGWKSCTVVDGQP